jgi:nucleotide-binding universal stress UspA family protein
MSGMLDGWPIVVGIDGSDPARHAAIWAAAEATRWRVPLKLVHAVSAAPAAGTFAPPPEFFDSLVSEGRDRLGETQADVHQTYPNLDVQMYLPTGRPVSTLIEESGQASLVVLGAPSAHAAAHRLLVGLC